MPSTSNRARMRGFSGAIVVIVCRIGDILDAFVALEPNGLLSRYQCCEVKNNGESWIFAGVSFLAPINYKTQEPRE